MNGLVPTLAHFDRVEPRTVRAVPWTVEQAGVADREQESRRGRTLDRGGAQDSNRPVSQGHGQASTIGAEGNAQTNRGAEAQDLFRGPQVPEQDRPVEAADGQA